MDPDGAPRPVRVLVCGSPDRGDDAAALLATARLPADAAALADVLIVGQLDVEALLDVPAASACLVADAAVGVAPGRVVVLPLADVARGGTAPRSSHSLPVQQVIALAATLRGELPRGSFVGLGGATFGLGQQPSPAVAAALEAYVLAIAAEIRRLAEASGSS